LGVASVVHSVPAAYLLGEERGVFIGLVEDYSHGADQLIRSGELAIDIL